MRRTVASSGPAISQDTSWQRLHGRDILTRFLRENTPPAQQTTILRACTQEQIDDFLFQFAVWNGECYQRLHMDELFQRELSARQLHELCRYVHLLERQYSLSLLRQKNLPEEHRIRLLVRYNPRILEVDASRNVTLRHELQEVLQEEIATLEEIRELCILHHAWGLGTFSGLANLHRRVQAMDAAHREILLGILPPWPGRTNAAWEAHLETYLQMAQEL